MTSDGIGVRFFFCSVFLSLLWSSAIPTSAFVATTTTSHRRRDRTSILLDQQTTSTRTTTTTRPPFLFQHVVLGAAASNPWDSEGTATKTKKRRRKNSTPFVTDSEPAQAGGSELSAQDLADHLSTVYTNGSGGVLRRRQKRRQRDRGNTPDPKATARDTNNNNNKSTHPDRPHHASILERRPVLVLNADYQPLSYLPLSLWNWQDAVKSVFSGKVTVVDVYDDITIRAVSFEIPLPSVIALQEYVKPVSATTKHRPAFTKRNVFLRDEFRCQYCNERFHTHDLSLDHVVPRCQGGRLHWENAVTSCLPCNGRKGSLPVSELQGVGMRLLRKPVVPSHFELANIATRMRPSRGIHHPTWDPYLGLSNKRQQREQEGEEQRAQFSTG